ncbi:MULTISPECIES: 50S ribosomal protein L18 [Roseivirga]|jgi:large subunit ribosomal protein L18|uniref:Large ribosomal subunit protein uL18 n=1 Tax=Roseivirga thermotolerans TaxID=1758176 RepID=A0ABQ3I944_9BACT|nr:MULTISPECIES: 50S ribosomal protein L18 [Roseivirga]MEC7752732.1 50S ribosomal protein L18 [Bacteroidota bacterium]GHE66096.1 50S ribosomal protein L18 [Roseivirga thermotolerans]|tara:strand:+ start:3370 stop:3714 length:345 start_codon:yes stop_codon:yes gene_type:complete
MAISKSRLRIKRGIRKKISGTAARPRVSVFKSNTKIYAQIIDDEQGHTLVSASSAELGAKENTTVEVAREVGKKLAEKATANGISSVVFDRNGYVYHGKVKALADGAREGGLKF